MRNVGKLVLISAGAVALAVVTVVVLECVLANRLGEPSPADLKASQARYFPCGPGGEW